MTIETGKLISKQRCLFFLAVSVTLLLRGEYEVVYNDYGTDKVIQLSAAKNLLEGKNISRCYADPSDLSIDNYSTFSLWPYGYPLIASFVSVLTGDLLRAGILLDIGAVILLIFVSLQLVWLLGVDRRGMMAVLLFLGFTHAPFCYITSTGLIALSFYMLAFWYSLRLLLRGEQHILKWVLLGSFLFLPSFFRYAYYPLVAPIPLTIHWIGWKTRRKSLITGSMISMITAGALIAAQAAVMKWNTGQYSCVSDYERGLFLHHLLHIDPFPIRALFHAHTLLWRLGLPPGSMLHKSALIVGSCAVLGVIAFQMMKKRVWQFAPEDKEVLWKAFLMIGGLTVFLNITPLMFLSITCPPQSGWISFWTFVQETRYYAPSMLFIILFFVASVFREDRVRGTRVFMTCVFLISFVICSHRVVKMYMLNETRPTFQYNNMTRLRIAEIVENMVDETDGRVVLADRDICILLHRGKTILGVEEVLGSDLAHTSPLRLLLRLHAGDVEKHGSWLEEHYAQLVEDFGETALYQIDLK